MKNKAIAGILISLGFLVPVLASAHSSHNKPSKDRTPPSLASISIASSNADPARAKAGDTVTITFTTSEKVTPVVLAETKTLFVKPLNTTGNNWSASYVVNAKDHTGQVDYLLAMADTSKNYYVCSSARIPFVAYCPTTDGSSVTIYKDAVPPPPPADTEAPVIAPHADVYATTTEVTLALVYELPSATDNVDASVAVSCTPASGSTFSLGTTTVTCTAQDVAGNSASSTFKVIVSLSAPEQTDTEAPVIDAHADVFATPASSTGSVVSYSLPTAVDAQDGAVAVSCAPASGSLFALGTTTVTCTAQDIAGNTATASFGVGVYGLYTMAGQEDESFWCGENTGSWRYCDDTFTFGFTDTPASSKATIELGQGSTIGIDMLQSVTIASKTDFLHPWDITISCFTDSAHTTPCGDWAAILDDADASGDGKHWVADFSSLGRTFNQNDYYVMTIDDTGWDTPAYGSASPLEPYWVITGLH